MREPRIGDFVVSTNVEGSLTAQRGMVVGHAPNGGLMIAWFGFVSTEYPDEDLDWGFVVEEEAVRHA